jgi:hypothetical protein
MAAVVKRKGVLKAVFDDNGVKRCAWDDCKTILSRYNDHVVCASHSYDYAMNYLPVWEPKKSRSE